MSEPRVGCWVVGGVGCVGGCICLAALIAVVAYSLQMVAVVPQGIAIGLEQQRKGLEFMVWLFSALLGWLLKSIFPFL